MDHSGTTNNLNIVPFLDVINDLFLFQHITDPTRFRQGDTPSLLDLVFTNELDMINKMNYLLPLGNSDHVCIQFNMVCYSELMLMPQTLMINILNAYINHNQCDTTYR